MKTPLRPHILAATSDGWILAHDIMGVAALAILAFAAFYFYRRRNWPIPPDTEASGEVGLRRMVRRAQAWALFAVLVAVTVFFFFVFPRITSQRAQDYEGDGIHTQGERNTVGA